MLNVKLFANCMACAAALGMMLPTGSLSAQTPVQSSQVKKQIKTYDVVLSNGKLTGQHLTATGAGFPGAKISVRQAGVEIARVTTDANGIFSVSGLKNGVYDVVTPQGIISARVWDATIAPPTAHKTLTVISGDAIRGQVFDGVNGINAMALGLGIAGTTLGIIALTDDPNSP